jgi:type IV pilus assembly protein PilN
MIRVNLLANAPGAAPKDWLPREQRSAATGLLMLLGTGILVTGWWFYLHRQTTQLDTKIASAQSDLTRLKKVADLVDQASARNTELTERLAVIERLRSVQHGPVNLLETVSRSLPEGLWLTEMKQNVNTVQIEGRALTLTAVTDFTEQMQNSGLFMKPVEIVTTTTENVEDLNVIHFIVKGEGIGLAEVPPPPPVKGKPGKPGAAAAKSGN